MTARCSNGNCRIASAIRGLSWRSVPGKEPEFRRTEHRALTHHEAARIQGFPDEYKWVGSKASIARQIGNAVPVALAKAVGQQLVRLF